MLNLGTPELIVILVVALLVLGPTRLPEVARQAGRAVAQVRGMAEGFQSELQRAASGDEAGRSADAPAAAPAAMEGALARPVRRAPLVAAPPEG